MRNIWTIAKREYDHYFITPIAYLVAFAMLFTVGLIFVLNISAYTQIAFQNPTALPDISPVTGAFIFLLVLSAPALTMRLLSDEARMGTLELLLTAPVRDFELVAGKWLGSMLYVLTLVLVTAVYPILLNSFIDPGIDWALVGASYLGLILVAASILAVGTGISALFTNQIAAFFATFITIVFLWWLAGFPAQVINDPGVKSFFEYLSMQTHLYTNMVKGDLFLSDIIYFLSLIALGLFTGTIAVEMRRWR